MPPKKSTSPSKQPRLYAAPILASVKETTEPKKRGRPTKQDLLKKAEEDLIAKKKEEAAAKRKATREQNKILKENLKAGVSFVAGTKPPEPANEPFVEPKPMTGKLPAAKKQKKNHEAEMDELLKKAQDAVQALEKDDSDNEDIDISVPSPASSSSHPEEDSGEKEEEEKAEEKKTPIVPRKPQTLPKAPTKKASKKEDFPPWLPTFFSTVLKEAYSSTDQKVSKKKIQEQAKEESSKAWADPVRKERAQAVADDHVNKMYKSIFGY